MIGIPSRPNSIVDYNMNLIPTKDLSRQSWFQYKFDLFLIKVDPFLCNFDLLIKIRSKNDHLKDWKSWLKDRKSKNYSKKCIYIYWLFQSLLITFNIKSIYLEGIQTFWLIFEPLESISSQRFWFQQWILIEKVNEKSIWSQYKMKFGSRSIRLPKLNIYS